MYNRGIVKFPAKETAPHENDIPLSSALRAPHEPGAYHQVHRLGYGPSAALDTLVHDRRGGPFGGYGPHSPMGRGHGGRGGDGLGDQHTRQPHGRLGGPAHHGEDTPRPVREDIRALLRPGGRLRHTVFRGQAHHRYI